MSDVLLILGDCLDKMHDIAPESIDMVLCDLPFQITRCAWDSAIDLEKLWEHYRRICKKNAAIVLFGSQPFTTKLIASNYGMFKYELIWEKSKASNFMDARKRPLKAHENILVFSKGTPRYNPVMSEGASFSGKGRSKKGAEWDGVGSVPNPTFRNDNKGTKFPSSVIYFKTAESEKIGALHPTMKPVALCEYLIKTYSNENDLILDNCAGSGTTGIAAANLKRRSILIEKDPHYMSVMAKRIEDWRTLHE